MRLGRYLLDLSKRTHIMGILNLSPDSFYDGGRWVDVDAAVNHAKDMARAGADIIDVGGESTRPGSKPITAELEKKRVIPVIERLIQELDLPISIDTYKAEVAEACLSLGVHMVNDISGLRFDPRMKEVVASYDAAIVIMHIKGRPTDMQNNPQYGDLIGEIMEYLREGIRLATSSGIQKKKIIVDPGIGFGKTTSHNLEIIRRLKALKALGCPILVGPSRKSVIGNVLGLDVEDRLHGTSALVALSIMNGASIVRVHDVKEMWEVARMVDAVKKGLRYEST